MSTIRRWYGLDLFRGFAIYAVILLHADEGVTQAPDGWNGLVQFSGFAVPFFLAASFFLAIKKLLSSEQPYPLKDRIHRLIIPYAFWTLLYLVYKTSKYIIDNDLEKLSKLFEDPVGIIFFGSAAFHLYFIPLLITGTFLLKVFDLIKIKVISSFQVFSLWLISVVLYQTLLSTHNEFNLATLSALEPALKSVSEELSVFLPVRLLAVGLAWTLRCSPYLFSAILIHRSKAIHNRLVQPNRVQAEIIILAFFLVNGAGHLILPTAIHEILRGYLAVLAAIALSTFLKEIPIIVSVGVASFGIYLMHLIILEGFQIVSNRLDILDLSRPSLSILLLITTLSFIITWLLTVYFIRFKHLSKLLFGN